MFMNDMISWKKDDEWQWKWQWHDEMRSYRFVSAVHVILGGCTSSPPHPLSSSVIHDTQLLHFSTQNCMYSQICLEWPPSEWPPSLERPFSNLWKVLYTIGFHANWTSLERPPVCKDHFYLISSVVVPDRFHCTFIWLDQTAPSFTQNFWTVTQPMIIWGLFPCFPVCMYPAMW